MRKAKTAGMLMLILLICALCASAGAETVTYRGVTVEKDAEEVDLGNMNITQWAPFYDFLDQLPKVKKVDMFGTVLNLQVYTKLRERYPGVDFGAQLRYGKRRMRTDDTAFSTLYSGGDRLHSYDEIAMLACCRNLYALDVGHHPIRKLDFLYDLPELRVLIVAICDVTDITPIASLKHLEYLEIFHNQITDVSCLSGLQYLMDLNLVKNQVADLSPLAEIKSLKRLWIHRCNLSDPAAPDEQTVAMLQEALPDCHIDAESTSTAGGWRKHPHYEVIHRMFRAKSYEPFEDSDPENLPEPWRTERLQEQGGAEE